MSAAMMAAQKKNAKRVLFSTDNQSGAAETVGEAKESHTKAMTSIEQWNEIIDSKVPVIF